MTDRRLCNYGHTEEDHERAGACERPGLGTRWAGWQASLTVEMTEVNLPAMETFFDLCLQCTERRQNCTCHERGYN